MLSPGNSTPFQQSGFSVLLMMSDASRVSAASASGLRNFLELLSANIELRKHSQFPVYKRTYLLRDSSGKVGEERQRARSERSPGAGAFVSMKMM